MEAVTLRPRNTPCPWLMACANMEPMIKRVPAADVPTCRSKGPDGAEVERMCDKVMARKGPKANIRKVEVIEDYHSRPHKLVRFEVRCKKEPQEVRILKVPMPLPGVTGGKVLLVGDSEQNAKL